MTKTERELLKHLAAAYYFILGLRSDAIRRKDGHYIDKTFGIERNIDVMTKKYPGFKRYFNAAREKAKASVKQEKESKAQSPPGGEAK